MPEPKTKLSNVVRQALRELAEEQMDELWEDAEVFGTWVRKGDVPEVTSEVLLDSGLIEDDQRINTLEKGGGPTAEEIREFQEWWAESNLEDGDADFIPGYALSTILDKQGHKGVALLLRTGYSFSGVDTELEGIFATKADAIEHMKSDGWCS